MTNGAELADGVAEVRALVAADGADLELVNTGPAPGAVRLRLVLGGAECAECVLPRDMLAKVALDMLRVSVPGTTQVEIDDPRVPAGKSGEADGA